MSKKVVCYRRSKKETNGVLKIRISEGAKKTFISLKETIPFKDFNSTDERVRKTNPNHAYYNNLIEKTLSKYLIIDKKDIFTKKQKVMFSYVAELYLEHLNNTGSFKTFTSHINHFKKYLENIKQINDIDMLLIDNKTIEGFSKYLLKTVGVSPYSHNKYLKNIKTVINYGIKKRMISYEFHPFLDYDYEKATPHKQNIYLNEDEIYRLKKLKYGNYVDEFWLNNEGDSDIKKELKESDFTAISDILYNTQLMCLLQLSSQGIRVSDLLLLRPILFRDNYFRFKQKKTGIFVNVYLNEYLIEILTKIIEYKLLTNYYEDLESEEYELIFDNINEIKQNVIELKSYKFKGKENNAKIIEVLKSNNVRNITNIIEALKMNYTNDFFCLSGLDPNDFEHYFKTGKTNKEEDGKLSAKTTVYNSDLKTIQKHAKITKVLTSHIFRHTFANTALTHNTDLYAISKALGHSNISQTETYLRDFDTNKVEALINNTINKIIDLGNYLNFELKE